MAVVCNSCGAELGFKAHHFYRGQDLCPICLKSIEAEDRKATPQGSNAGGLPHPDWRGGLSCLGCLLGALIGILTRPSLFLLGQLPIPVVLSRGATLSGIDQILVPAAQSSFNHVVLWSVVGAVVGLAAGLVHWSANSEHSDRLESASAHGDSYLRPPSTAAHEVLDNDAILSMIDAGLGDDVIVDKIKRSQSLFALSTTHVTNLKTQGVSDRLIATMIETQSQRGVAHT